ncbi:glycosyltransferase [Vibrio sp. 10N.222.55.C6]|uniref:glycosyltransferase n=1 Tax=Vibrio sp. 10N.222.55.C6 TaxID=3229649 RepID=UPI00354B4C70
MKFRHFTGRVIQVIEAVDIYDACSNQVLNIDRYFSDHFGLTSIICSKHIHPEVKIRNYTNIDNLDATEDDIIIYHHSGFSESCIDKVITSKAVKVILYHNITPHEFFSEGSELYELCKKGREQLRRVLQSFDFAWGDSNYNLAELVALGFDKYKSFLLPIIIDKDKFTLNYEVEKTSEQHIISIGRVCENKCQTELIEAFSKSDYNGKLYLVGGYDKNSEYGAKVNREIKRLDMSGRVVVTGKITQEELNRLLITSDALVSRSEHEGFCVPLLEASVAGVPVIALNKAAVGEVLGDSPYLFSNDGELIDLLGQLPLSQSLLSGVLNRQESNFERYSEESWLDLADRALDKVIGSKNRFKTVSIVICTYNRADYLERALSYLCDQYNANFEVIVVNGPSTDNTEDVILKWKDKIKVANNSEANLSISRNMGIELASGDIIAFIDDDALPFYDWVDQLLIGFNSRHQLAAGLGGPTYYSGTLDFQAVDIAVDKYGDGIVNPDISIKSSSSYKRSLLGTNSAFRADYLKSIGGFDEEYDYFLDETDVCFRLEDAGFRNCHHDSLYLRHEFAQSGNRTNKYKYNYYSIVKNTVYFALNFAGNNKEDILSEVRSRVQRMRVDYINEGVSVGVLSSREGEQLVKDVWDGFSAGEKRASETKKLLTTELNSTPFKQFLISGKKFKQKHIAIISSEFPPFTPSGGVGTLYYNLASELLVMGHKVTVIAKGKSDAVTKGNFTIHFIDDRNVYDFASGSHIIDSNLNWSMLAGNRVAEINENQSVDIVDSCIWDVEAYAVSRLKEKLNIKVVTRLVTPFAVANESNEWGISGSELSNIMALEKNLLEHSDSIIPISEAILETFENKYGLEHAGRIDKVEAGIAYWPTYDVSQGYNDLKGFDVLEGTEDRFKVLFFGRLEARKGIDILLRAADLYQSRYPEDCISFIVAGKDIINVPNFIKSNSLDHLNSNLYLLGEVSLWDRDKLYSYTDVVAFPSRYESFGLVPLEAFVHGKPVIASNAGAIPEVVKNDHCGLLFNDGDVEQLCEAIKELYENKCKLEQLSKGALERVRVLSSVEMAKKTEKVYKKILGLDI